MSRKNLDEHGRLRSKTVSFRVSPEEGQRLVAMVAMSGLTKQDYIVARLLCQEVTVVSSSRVQKGMKEGMQMVYRELLRLGEGDEVQPEVLDVTACSARFSRVSAAKALPSRGVRLGTSSCAWSGAISDVLLWKDGGAQAQAAQSRLRGRAKRRAAR